MARIHMFIYKSNNQHYFSEETNTEKVPKNRKISWCSVVHLVVMKVGLGEGSYFSPIRVLYVIDI